MPWSHYSCHLINALIKLAGALTHRSHDATLENLQMMSCNPYSGRSICRTGCSIQKWQHAGFPTLVELHESKRKSSKYSALWWIMVPSWPSQQLQGASFCMPFLPPASPGLLFLEGFSRCSVYLWSYELWHTELVHSLSWTALTALQQQRFRQSTCIAFSLLLNRSMESNFHTYQGEAACQPWQRLGNSACVCVRACVWNDLGCLCSGMTRHDIWVRTSQLHGWACQNFHFQVNKLHKLPSFPPWTDCLLNPHDPYKHTEYIIGTCGAHGCHSSSPSTCILGMWFYDLLRDTLPPTLLPICLYLK